MIPTPDLSHLTTKDYDHVYEPAEDTFLFLDALEEDAESLKNMHASICLEVGPGSGCVTGFIGKILGPSVLYLCTDINPHACNCTRLTGLQNKVDIDPVNGSLATPFQSRLAHSVDVILFNPPYVPTPEEEALIAQTSKDIGGAWAGGWDGLRVTNIFLQAVEGLLSEKGRFYLVALKENNVPQILKTMKDVHNLTGKVILERRAGREYLYILCFTR
ncbi:S-adenosyl-L-methionine-dependent methyltransferase [Agrocybe pediades]|nr:S-adenosyl-L-methionine-dependent methyltransferase [Agrocybe pediades]